MPLTISALTMPNEAASLGEMTFSGKMTNHVVKVGGNAPSPHSITLLDPFALEAIGKD